MKIQIKRFPLHQNAKVFAVLMALRLLVFAVPAFIAFSFIPTLEGQNAPPAVMLLLFPTFYLVFGYLMISIGCALYNWVAKYMGGLEYETGSKDA